MKLYKPFDGNFPVSSPFGPRDLNGDGDKTDRFELHDGIDFAMPIGTPLKALADGVVVIAPTIDRIEANDPNLGLVVRMDNGNHWAFYHMKRVDVKVGQRVVGGATVVGLSGNTGFSTGPHLHISIFGNRPFRNPVDPTPYVRSWNAQNNQQKSDHNHINMNTYTLKKGGWRWNAVQEIINAGIWSGTVNDNLDRFNRLNPNIPEGGFRPGDVVTVKPLVESKPVQAPGASNEVILPAAEFERLKNNDNVVRSQNDEVYKIFSNPEFEGKHPLDDGNSFGWLRGRWFSGEYADVIQVLLSECISLWQTLEVVRKDAAKLEEGAEQFYEITRQNGQIVDLKLRVEAEPKMVAPDKKADQPTNQVTQPTGEQFSVQKFMVGLSKNGQIQAGLGLLATGFVAYAIQSYPILEPLKPFLDEFVLTGLGTSVISGGSNAIRNTKK